MSPAELKPAPRNRIVMAFAAIYLIWGSTYLAIRYAIDTIPPFLMAGVRYLIAGAVLYLFARWKEAPRPKPSHWIGATIVGALLLLGGNGGVVWAEQRVASGLAALPIATVPLWTVLLDSLIRRARPTKRVMAGVFLGFLGLVILVGPGHIAGSKPIDPIGVTVLVIAALCWASGSLVSRRVSLPASGLLATAMEMLAGGTLLVLGGLALGEEHRFHFADVTPRSLVALSYLIVFGSLIGLSAYIWLLSVAAPARVSTYAFVNPVIAVFLGWAFAGEPLTARMLLATAVIVGAVVLITTERIAREPAQEEIARGDTNASEELPRALKHIPSARA